MKSFLQSKCHSAAVGRNCHVTNSSVLSNPREVHTLQLKDIWAAVQEPYPKQENSNGDQQECCHISLFSYPTTLLANSCRTGLGWYFIPRGRGGRDSAGAVQIDRRDKSVAAARQSFDKDGGIGGISQSLPQLLDGSVQPFVKVHYCTVRPQSSLEFVASNQFPWSFKQ